MQGDRRSLTRPLWLQSVTHCYHTFFFPFFWFFGSFLYKTLLPWSLKYILCNPWMFIVFETRFSAILSLPHRWQKLSFLQLWQSNAAFLWNLERYTILRLPLILWNSKSVYALSMKFLKAKRSWWVSKRLLKKTCQSLDNSLALVMYPPSRLWNIITNREALLLQSSVTIGQLK